ncbi:MAG: Mut7-C ubiquitin/RNAse domain-containing protein [Marinifilaceae bacterium]|nr:Mut7-C ubiquitin/RNAse domain-containing protein [Marinifilaceae bacterium]
MILENNTKKCFIFRFYAELNDFLPEHRKQKSFVEYFKTPITLNDVLVSLGIPFSEVDLVLVNGISVQMNHKLKENDRIAVYPKFESLDITSVTNLREKPLRDTKFILDCHLGKLAKYLRMLGFDSFYQNQIGDEEIIEIAAKEGRVILTRDKLLLKSIKITHGYFVRAITKHEQLKEVVRKFDLYKQFESFTRCMSCNEKLKTIDKVSIIGRIGPDIARTFNQFYHCPNCDKIYWQGSHFKRMEGFIRELVKE